MPENAPDLSNDEQEFLKKNSFQPTPDNQLGFLQKLLKFILGLLGINIQFGAGAQQVPKAFQSKEGIMNALKSGDFDAQMGQIEQNAAKNFGTLKTAISIGKKFGGEKAVDEYIEKNPQVKTMLKAMQDIQNDPEACREFKEKMAKYPKSCELMRHTIEGTKYQHLSSLLPDAPGKQHLSRPSTTAVKPPAPTVPITLQPPREGDPSRQGNPRPK